MRVEYILEVEDPRRGWIQNGRSFFKHIIVKAAERLEKMGKRVRILERQT